MLLQRTREWDLWRQKHICASDSPKIMGISPYGTAYDVYGEKLGYPHRKGQTDAMKAGNDAEEMIRAYAEKQLGQVLMPVCVESDEKPLFASSLDGINANQDIFVELKFNNAINHEMAEAGSIVDFHMMQMQHQWMTLGDIPNRKGYYVSYNKGAYAIVEVEPDKYMWQRIVEEGEKFWQLVQERTPPPITDDDYEIIDRLDTYEKIQRVISLSNQIREMEEEKDRLKNEALREIGHRNCRVGNFKVTKIERKGSIAYDKIPELENVNLESYRKAPVTTWKIA